MKRVYVTQFNIYDINTIYAKRELKINGTEKVPEVTKPHWRRERIPRRRKGRIIVVCIHKCDRRR
jgi:hypothetical protein